PNCRRLESHAPSRGRDPQSPRPSLYSSDHLDRGPYLNIAEPIILTTDPCMRDACTERPRTQLASGARDLPSQAAVGLLGSCSSVARIGRRTDGAAGKEASHLSCGSSSRPGSPAATSMPPT